MFRLSLFLAAILSSLGVTLAQSVPAPQLTDDFFTRAVKPLNVTPVTDPDNSYSDLIGPEGGQLTTLDAAGNTYTLSVPKGALGFPERLTMTPLTALKGMPFKGGVNAGVQLEPEGTFFVKPVTLEVEFARPPDLKTLTPFGYTGAGGDFATTMLMHDPGHYVFLLNHFSGAGFANSNEAERTAELVRQPLADEERISQYVRQALEAAHTDAVRAEEFGQEPDRATQDAAAAATARAFAEYEQQVIEPLSKVANQSCTVGTLYVQKALGLERQEQLLGASSSSGLGSLARALGPIADRCLDEEAQACFRTGDFQRLITFALGVERQAQLVGAETSASFRDKYARTLKACARFEVQLNATLTQKSDTDTTADTGGLIQARGKGSYSAAITSVLPVRLAALDFYGIPAELPNGNQPLPYASYAMSMTVNGGVALAQTGSGTLGVAANCAESGTGTTPGLLAAQFLPIFRSDPPDPNAPDPALDGLSPAQKRDVIRILHNTPKVGLLAPPRTLDLPNTILTIGVGKPTEQATSSCDQQRHDLTTWLDSWNKQLGEIGKAAPVPYGSGTDTEPGWELNSWQKATAFPLRIVQDVPRHEALSGSSYDEVWHLDITVVHTPTE